MKTITFEEAFPLMKDFGCSRSGYCAPSYEEMADKFGDETLIFSRDNDYQGSSFALLKSGDKFGYLQFGWGSCSGCDALEAADTYADFEKLFNELRDSVRWFDSLQQFLSWCNEHDWAGEWSYHDGATGFVNAVNEKFGTEITIKERC